MAKFKVKVEDASYVVDAPDENTAWDWANQTHQQSAPAKIPAAEKPSTGPTTTAEVIARNPLTRFALGAAGQFLAANQILNRNPISRHFGLDKHADERLAQLRAMKGPDFDLMGLLGDIANPVGLGLAKALPAATTLAKKSIQGGGLGGWYGLMTPSQGGEDFAQQKVGQLALGTAAGGAIPGILAGVKAPLSAGYNVIEPYLPGGVNRIAGRTFNEISGERRPGILSALDNPQQIVPGSMPTAAEAAVPAGSAEFAGLQRILSARKPSEYLATEKGQDAARLAALSAVGKDKAALAAAESERAANAAQNYGAVRNDLINPTSFSQLMQDAVEGRLASKANALQTQGRYQTVAEQQQSLANGGVASLPKNTVVNGRVITQTNTPNEPVLNSGVFGPQTRSPSAYPVDFMQRTPPRYTENIQRVPEATAAAKDAGNIAAQRAKEASYLDSTMDILKNTVGLGDKSLSYYMSRPSMREAVNDAMKSAAETGSYFPQKAGDKFSVQNLQRIKESLDAGIRAASTAEANGKRPELSVAELEGTRKSFIKWLSEKSPGWQEARHQYSAESVPIDQMNLGQFLLGKLEPAINDLGASGAQRATMYAQALRDAPQTIKKATGQPRYERLDQVLNPTQMGAVEGVGKDLARKAAYEDMAAKGAEQARRQLKIIDPMRFPNALHRPIMIANAVLARVQGRAEGLTLDAMAKAMQDPKTVAEMMRAAGPSEKMQVSQAANYFRKLASQASGSMAGRNQIQEGQ